jgi:hypothetical protein
MVMVKNNVTFDDFRGPMKIVLLLTANINYFWWLPVGRRAQGIEGRAWSAASGRKAVAAARAGVK